MLCTPSLAGPKAVRVPPRACLAPRPVRDGLSAADLECRELCVARSHILRQCRKLCHRWGVLALRILRFAQELVPPGSQLNDLLLDPGTLLRQSVPFSLEDRNLSLGCGLRLQQSFLLAGRPLRRGHPQYFCSDHDGFMSLRPGGFSSFGAVARDQRWR